MAAVAERKEEQKMATMERQRMEDILNICAEYEAAQQTPNGGTNGMPNSAPDVTIDGAVIKPNVATNSTHCENPNVDSRQSVQTVNGLQHHDRGDQSPVKIEISAANTTSSTPPLSLTNGGIHSNVWYEKLKDPDEKLEEQQQQRVPVQKVELSAVQQLLGQISEVAPPKPPRMSVRDPMVGDGAAVQELGVELAKVCDGNIVGKNISFSSNAVQWERSGVIGPVFAHAFWNLKLNVYTSAIVCSN